MSLATLNLAALRAQARDKADVSVTDFSNTKLDRELNIGYANLAVLLANLGEDYFEEQRARFDLVANSGLYSQPEDCIAFKRFRFAFSGTPVAVSAYTLATVYNPLQMRTVIEEESVPITNPIVDITGTYFRLKPKPTVAVTNGGLLDYIAMPSALVNTGDIPVIPVAYHDKIATYAARAMAFKYEKWSKHAKLDNEWRSTEAELQARIAERAMNAETRFLSPLEAGPAYRRPRELG
jgi:hypothetical protein